MRARVIALLLVAAVAPSASASVCATDVVPAASLLFPYVTLDYTRPYGGVTTILSITNVSHRAQIVHVTLWTEFDVAIFDFNIVLTGYDQQQVNLRDVLVRGQVPVTLAEPHGLLEGAQDDGPVSSRSPSSPEVATLPQPEATTALGDRCPPESPGYPGRYEFPIPPRILEYFESWFVAARELGVEVAGGCGDILGTAAPADPPRWYSAGAAADRPATFYATADVVQTCGRLWPDHPDYWTPFDDPDGGQARYDNVLMGEVLWITSTTTSVAPAVHLEADRDLAAVAAPAANGAPASFYHRYSAGTGHTSDFREPLPTAWAMSYYAGGLQPVAPRTRILAWKGSTNHRWLPDLAFQPRIEDPDHLAASDCLAYTYYAWDRDENVYASSSCDNSSPWGPPGWAICPNLFPLATQEVDAGDLELPDAAGWLLFVWPPSNFVGDAADTSPDRYQTWMATVHSAWGTQAGFMPATVMANANCWPDQVMPQLGVDYDYVPGGPPAATP